MGRRRRGSRSRSAWTQGIRLILMLLAVIMLLIGAAFTAANVIPPTRAHDESRPVDTSALAPSECAGLTLTKTVSGTGIITGTIDNDWIIGSEATDTIEGLAGDDCIEGKGSDDIIDGGLGNDVCIGGGGNDTFIGCESEFQ